jgi:hypothetical protein
MRRKDFPPFSRLFTPHFTPFSTSWGWDLGFSQHKHWVSLAGRGHCFRPAWRVSQSTPPPSSQSFWFFQSWGILFGFSLFSSYFANVCASFHHTSLEGFFKSSWYLESEHGVITLVYTSIIFTCDFRNSLFNTSISQTIRFRTPFYPARDSFLQLLLFGSSRGDKNSSNFGSL